LLTKTTTTTTVKLAAAATLLQSAPTRGNLLGNFRIRTVSLVSNPLPAVSRRPIAPREAPNRENTVTAFSIDVGTETNAVANPRDVFMPVGGGG
jgi:hypothetical protein